MTEGIVGFFGAGQMAQALAAGWVRTNLVPAERIAAYDPHPAANTRFKERVGECLTMGSVEELTQKADVLVLAVKPQHIQSVLTAASPAIDNSKLVVSIAAGVTIAQLESWLPPGTPVIRVMPNTPCLIGRGASGFSRGTSASQEQAELVRSLLSAVGFASETTEPMLDAVTGLSGSGPAYVYTIIEALADGGVRAGLPRALAAELAARTVAGAAEMVLTTGQHPAALRDAVASPGGTTIAGLATLEEHGIRSALIEAVTTSANRSIELGKQ